MTKTKLNGWAPRRARRKRPGVHAKTKRSGLKGTVRWRKPYRGQGRG